MSAVGRVFFSTLLVCSRQRQCGPCHQPQLTAPAMLGFGKHQGAHTPHPWSGKIASVGRRILTLTVGSGKPPVRKPTCSWAGQFRNYGPSSSTRYDHEGSLKVGAPAMLLSPGKRAPTSRSASTYSLNSRTPAFTLTSVSFDQGLLLPSRAPNSLAAFCFRRLVQRSRDASPSGPSPPSVQQTGPTQALATFFSSSAGLMLGGRSFSTRTLPP